MKRMQRRSRSDDTKRAAPAQTEPLRTGPLFKENPFLLLVEPGQERIDLTAWVKENRSLLNKWLYKHGGVLFRGFGLDKPSDLQWFAVGVCDKTLSYTERSSPRHGVYANVYTSTDYPPEYSIFLHNEMSYQKAWPMKVFFSCNVEPGSGGETPLADCRQIYQRIPNEIRDRFARHGIMYIRNYSKQLGLDWTEVFQTKDRAEVEASCRRTGLDYEWLGDDKLRTRAVRPLITRHPYTGDSVWFNHGTFFHVSTLAENIRNSLLSSMEEIELPSNTYYGDGSPIEPDVLDTLRGIYLDELVKFPWKQGDVLLIDNMLTAHAREPFKGPRKILVAMGEPMHPALIESASAASP